MNNSSSGEFLHFGHQLLSSEISNKSAAQRAQEAENYYDLERAAVVMLIVFSVVGVLGNGMIFIIYWKLVKMTTTQFLIFFIAIFDFLSALIPVPLLIIYKTSWFDINSIFFCKPIYATLVFVTPGSLLMLLVTLVRYFHMCRPHLLYKIEKNIIMFCVLVILYALLYCVVDAIVCRIDEESLHCFIDTKRFNTVETILYYSRFAMPFVVAIILIILNVLMIRKHLKPELTVTMIKRGNIDPFARTLDTKVERRNSKFYNNVDQNQNTYPSDGFSNCSDDFHSVVSMTAGSSISKKNRSVSDNNSSVGKSSQAESSGNGSYSKPFKTSNTFTVHDIERFRPQANSSDNGKRWNCFPTKTFRKTFRRFRRKKKSRKTVHFFKGASKTTVMIIAVSLSYVISYLPIAFLFSYHASTDTSTPFVVRKYILVPLRHMFLLNCAANPVLYMFVNPSFRYKCLALLRFWKRTLKNHNSN